MKPATELTTILATTMATVTLMNITMVRSVGQALRVAVFWQAALLPRP